MHIGHYIKDVVETVVLVSMVVGAFIGATIAHFWGKFRRRKQHITTSA